MVRKRDYVKIRYGEKALVFVLGCRDPDDDDDGNDETPNFDKDLDFYSSCKCKATMWWQTTKALFIKLEIKFGLVCRFTYTAKAMQQVLFIVHLFKKE